MSPSIIARRARALISYKRAGGETISPEWLVSTLEKMGATAHQADQAAAGALASPETGKIINQSDYAAALRAAADKHERRDGR